MHLWPSLSLKAVLWAAAWHLVSHVLSSSHRHVSGSYSSLISSDLDPRTRDSLLAFWRRELGQGRSDLSRSPQLITRRSSPSDALESAPSPEDSLLAGLLEGVPKYDTCAEPDGTIPPSLPGDAPWVSYFSEGYDHLTFLFLFFWRSLHHFNTDAHDSYPSVMI